MKKHKELTLVLVRNNLFDHLRPIRRLAAADRAGIDCQPEGIQCGPEYNYHKSFLAVADGDAKSREVAEASAETAGESGVHRVLKNSWRWHMSMVQDLMTAGVLPKEGRKPRKGTERGGGIYYTRVVHSLNYEFTKNKHAAHDWSTGGVPPSQRQNLEGSEFGKGSSGFKAWELERSSCRNSWASESKGRRWHRGSQEGLRHRRIMGAV
ncbi:hypothetical protein C8R43DRAFT_960957 [Mycena crocata]|nr:hypothetical protein C8R43DRAFT_960957 [Mycena crocata]